MLNVVSYACSLLTNVYEQQSCNSILFVTAHTLWATALVHPILLDTLYAGHVN